MTVTGRSASSGSSNVLVSVIMPVYNAGKYLRPAVESILRQTHSNLELILVDDGSIDGCINTIDDIDDPRVRRYRQQNSGKPVAMNFGLSVAQGEFFAVNDADDESHPQRVERQVSCLIAEPSLAGVFCGCSLIIEGNAMAPVFRAKSAVACAEDIRLGRMPAHDPTMMCRMSVVRDFRYSEDLPIVEGYDFVLRVGERHSFLVLGECLYGYRVHLNSVTKRNVSRRNQLLQKAFDRMCDRRGISRRQAPGLRPALLERRGGADNNLGSHFTTSVADQVLSGQRWGALATGAAYWRMNPFSLYGMKPLVYAAAPRSLMSWYIVTQQRRRNAAASMALN